MSRLKQRLDELGMTAQQLADKTGILKSSISQYVNDKGVPKNATAKKIAEALGGNPLWYMEFDVPFEMDHTMEMVMKYDALTPMQRQLVDDLINTLLEGAKK